MSRERTRALLLGVCFGLLAAAHSALWAAVFPSLGVTYDLGIPVELLIWGAAGYFASQRGDWRLGTLGVATTIALDYGISSLVVPQIRPELGSDYSWAVLIVPLLAIMAVSLGALGAWLARRRNR